MSRYRYHRFPYRTPPELAGGGSTDTPVAICGAGPIGLAAAIDLALHGVRSVILDDNDVVSVGSRAICWAKRTLEIFDRLGVGERMVAKGVTWQVGRLFDGDREVCSFDLLPEPGHRMPAFINLQQYYVEQYLVERCGDFPGLIDLRWKNRVTQSRRTPTLSASPWRLRMVHTNLPRNMFLRATVPTRRFAHRSVSRLPDIPSRIGS